MLSVTIYPNVAEEFATLESLDEIEDISVYSINGRLIKYIPFLNSSKIKLDVSDIPNGLYLIKYRLNDKYQSKKLMVKH